MSEEILKRFRYNEDEKLPTDFAIAIATKFKIYTEVDPSNTIELMQMESDLKTFQQMCISCTFEEAMLAYYDKKFNDEQMNALKLIYKATIPWLKGEVVSTLLIKIGNKKITNKDFAESIKMIIEQLETKTESGEQKGSKKINGLAFQLAEVKKKD